MQLSKRAGHGMFRFMNVVAPLEADIAAVPCGAASPIDFVVDDVETACSRVSGDGLQASTTSDHGRSECYYVHLWLLRFSFFLRN